MTPTVPVASAPAWARASMPRAMPETTTSPAAPRSAASRSARWSPPDDALRAPTTAIESRDSRSPRPHTLSTGGGSAMAASAVG